METGAGRGGEGVGVIIASGQDDRGGVPAEGVELKACDVHGRGRAKGRSETLRGDVEAVQLAGSLRGEGACSENVADVVLGQRRLRFGRDARGGGVKDRETSPVADSAERAQRCGVGVVDDDGGGALAPTAAGEPPAWVMTAAVL